MRLFSAFLSTFLIPLVAVMPLRAELAASIAANPSSNAAGVTPDQVSSLKIRLADESKATVEANSIVKGYAVMVTDSSGLPVADAAVAIRFPDEGATGFFVNGEHSAVAYTNAAGLAQFPQVNWGSTTGSLSVHVTAVKGELHAGALIEQTLVAAKSGNPSASSPVAPFPSAETSPSQSQPSQPPAVSPQPATSAEQTPVTAPVAKAKMPGVPTSVAAIHSGAAPDETRSASATTPSSDSVSVVNTSGSKGGSSSTKKWVILAAVLGAAGVGAALALAGGKGKGATAAAASTTTTIGTPTISVGH